MLRNERQATALDHRIAGVDHEVEQGQLELIGIDMRRPEVVRECRVDPDERADRAAQHLDHAVDQLRDVHRGRVQVLLPREGEQALRQRGAALGSLDRAVDQAARRVVVAQPFAQQLQVAEHGRQQVVEIVRDAAGELADRLHLLRLAEGLFELDAVLDLGRDPFLQGLVQALQRMLRLPSAHRDRRLIRGDLEQEPLRCAGEIGSAGRGDQRGVLAGGDRNERQPDRAGAQRIGERDDLARRIPVAPAAERVPDRRRRVGGGAVAGARHPHRRVVAPAHRHVREFQAEHPDQDLGQALRDLLGLVVAPDGWEYGYRHQVAQTATQLLRVVADRLNRGHGRSSGPRTRGRATPRIHASNGIHRTSVFRARNSARNCTGGM